MSEQSIPNSNSFQPIMAGVDLTVPEMVEVCFPQETYDSMQKLAKILRKVDARMRSQGYNIVDGKLVKI
jgi:hypothetical protein